VSNEEDNEVEETSLALCVVKLYDMR